MARVQGAEAGAAGGINELQRRTPAQINHALPGLFQQLSRRALPWRLAGIDEAARQLPHPSAAVEDEQIAALVVCEDQGEANGQGRCAGLVDCSDRDQTLPALIVDGAEDVDGVLLSLKIRSEPSLFVLSRSAVATHLIR